MKKVSALFFSPPLIKVFDKQRTTPKYKFWMTEKCLAKNSGQGDKENQNWVLCWTGF